MGRCWAVGVRAPSSAYASDLEAACPSAASAGFAPRNLSQLADLSLHRTTEVIAEHICQTKGAVPTTQRPLEMPRHQRFRGRLCATTGRSVTSILVAEGSLAADC